MVACWCQITTFKLKLIQRTCQSKETCRDYLLFWHRLRQDGGLLVSDNNLQTETDSKNVSKQRNMQGLPSFLALPARGWPAGVRLRPSNGNWFKERVKAKKHAGITFFFGIAFGKMTACSWCSSFRSSNMCRMIWLKKSFKKPFPTSPLIWKMPHRCIYICIFRCGPKGKLKVFEIKVSTNNGESLDQGAFVFEWTLHAYQKKSASTSSTVYLIRFMKPCNHTRHPKQ